MDKAKPSDVDLICNYFLASRKQIEIMEIMQHILVEHVVYQLHRDNINLRCARAAELFPPPPNMKAIASRRVPAADSHRRNLSLTLPRIHSPNRAFVLPCTLVTLQPAYGSTVHATLLMTL